MTIDWATYLQRTVDQRCEHDFSEPIYCGYCGTLIGKQCSKCENYWVEDVDSEGNTHLDVCQFLDEWESGDEYPY